MTMPIEPRAARRPVILLTFANDLTGESGGYLRNLGRERHLIQEALGRLGDQALVVVHSGVRIKDLYDLLALYNDDIVIFHYGGHAEADALLVEDEHGRPERARILGLSRRLSDLDSLALVFLNGCSTGPQVDILRRYCKTPVIVATDESIVDEYACHFAARFYRDLSLDRPLGAAFRSAEDELSTRAVDPSEAHRADQIQRPATLEQISAVPAERVANIRSVAGMMANSFRSRFRNLRPHGQPTRRTEWPWHLYVAEGNPGAANWRLSQVLGTHPGPSGAPAAGAEISTSGTSPAVTLARPVSVGSTPKQILAPRRFALAGLTTMGLTLLVGLVVTIGNVDCNGKATGDERGAAAPTGQAATPVTAPSLDFDVPQDMPDIKSDVLIFDLSPPDAGEDQTPPPRPVDAAVEKPAQPRPTREQVLAWQIREAIKQCKCDEAEAKLDELAAMKSKQHQRLVGLHLEVCEGEYGTCPK